MAVGTVSLAGARDVDAPDAGETGVGQGYEGDHRNALRPIAEQHPLVRDLRTFNIP
jgi:hypothetical protein